MSRRFFTFLPAAGYPDARIGHLGFSLWLIGCAGLAGCSQWPTAPQPEAASSPALPAFVYPADPPVVSAETLRSWIIRLDSAKTAIWVFDAATASADTARLLADSRDALRARQTALISLYTGLPSDWASRVVPLLRSADANFPCAVIEPGQGPTIGVWLASHPSVPPPGLYVLSAERRVIARAIGDEATVRNLLDGLAGNVPASQPGDTRPRWLARVRIVELAGGRVLARAEAEADAPSRLARLIAVELSKSLPSPPALAVAPVRLIGPAERHTNDSGILFSHRLGEELAAAGWQNLIPVQTVDEMLKASGHGPLSAEFDPGALSAQTDWQAILVGTIAVNAPPE